jgi:anti-anti-sigma factor
MFKTDLPRSTVWSPTSQGFRTWAWNGTPVVTMPTEIDFYNSGQLFWELLDATAHGPVIVADMGANTFIDSSCMRVLAQVGRMLASHGGELRVVISREFARRCLAITGDDCLMRLFHSLPEALSSAGQNREPQPQAA